MKQPLILSGALLIQCVSLPLQPANRPPLREMGSATSVNLWALPGYEWYLGRDGGSLPTSEGFIG